MVGDIVPGKRNAPTGHETKRGDATVIVLGGGLAVTSALFAAYMLYAGPFKPGADGFSLINLARNAPAPDDSAADPIITGSVRSVPAISRLNDIPAWFNLPGRAIDYRLKDVVADKAYVDITSGNDSFTWMVDRGGLMPGIGKVSEISRDQGGWVLRTGRVRISQHGAELMAED